VIVGVAAGEQGDPARAAHRVRGEGVLKRGALLTEKGPEAGDHSQLVVPHVVGEDDDEVGPLANLARLGAFLTPVRLVGVPGARNEQERDET
jgi:hypothetical protein